MYVHAQVYFFRKDSRPLLCRSCVNSCRGILGASVLIDGLFEFFVCIIVFSHRLLLTVQFLASATFRAVYRWEQAVRSAGSGSNA